jgi:hypothetical protein
VLEHGRLEPPGLLGAVPDGVRQVGVDRRHPAGEHRVVQALGHLHLPRLPVGAADEQRGVGRRRLVAGEPGEHDQARPPLDARVRRLHLQREDRVGRRLAAGPEAGLARPPDRVGQQHGKHDREPGQGRRVRPARHPQCAGRHDLFPPAAVGVSRGLLDDGLLEVTQPASGRVGGRLFEGGEQAGVEVGELALDPAGDPERVPHPPQRAEQERQHGHRDDDHHRQRNPRDGQPRPAGAGQHGQPAGCEGRPARGHAGQQQQPAVPAADGGEFLVKPWIVHAGTCCPLGAGGGTVVVVDSVAARCGTGF